MTFSHLTLILIACGTLGSAAVALALRDIIRAALLLVVSWVGIAAFYLWAGAEFIAFAQILVYVGAISMVVLFGVVLTRRTPVEINVPATAPIVRAFSGISAGGAVVLAILWGVLNTNLPLTSAHTATAAPALTMHSIGLDLMGNYAGAILIVGALLTAALLGSILLAAQDAPLAAPAPNPDSDCRCFCASKTKSAANTEAPQP